MESYGDGVHALALVRRLAANNAWSNLRLHRACARLSTKDYEATRTSFFPSIPLTLNHILTVDWYYLDALEHGGKGQSVFESDVPFPELEALSLAQRKADQRLVTFTDGLTSEDALDEIVSLQRRGRAQVERVGDVLVHLNVHQIHHRGQVHAMLSGTGIEPPQLDEFFMSEELPLREAELKDLGLPLR
jgi:uncharacterized damage-inducible protein DinB